MAPLTSEIGEADTKKVKECKHLFRNSWVDFGFVFIFAVWMDTRLSRYVYRKRFKNDSN